MSLDDSNPLQADYVAVEHFSLNAFSRMRVPLAVQVLSNTSAYIIKTHGVGPRNAQLDIMYGVNDLVDCCNDKLKGIIDRVQ